MSTLHRPSHRRNKAQSVSVRISARTMRAPLKSLNSTKQSQVPNGEFFHGDSRRSAYLKSEAPSKSTSTRDPSVGEERTTFNGIPEISVIRKIGPLVPEGISSRPPAKSLSGDSSLFHFEKISKASSDEMIFMDVAQRAGLDLALFLARAFTWKYRWPLLALRLTIVG